MGLRGNGGGEEGGTGPIADGDESSERGDKERGKQRAGKIGSRGKITWSADRTCRANIVGKDNLSDICRWGGAAMIAQWGPSFE